VLLCIAALCRATFYGTDEKVEAAHVACGEPAGQFGIIAQGSCGYTNSDGSLPFPREMYAANADTNVDYPGSCGRCYEVRDNTFDVCVGDMQLQATTGTVAGYYWYRAPSS
jgi:cullin-associated NEDD8-dissociated protein 1